MKLQRGSRGKLTNQPLKIKLQIAGAAVYDYTCFGVDKNEKLSDDRYMIFYNQTASPQNEIIYSAISDGAEFIVNLEKIPVTIQKLVFTGSIDGAGKMGEISSHKIFIEQSVENFIAEFGGADFQNEKAVTSIEIYRKDGWRFNIVARGFDGGLDTLLKFYGGEQVEEPQKVSQPPKVETALKKVSLEKKIAEAAPKLVSLVKPLKVALEKKNLQETVARVALVMDISGSMYSTYSDGTVQEIVNKIVPLAVQFDDDGELDFWYYGDICQRRDAVTLQNYEKAVPYNWSNLMDDLGCGNNEPVVMREVIDEYKKSRLPAYIVFISDGGVSREDEIKRLLIESSKMPIFWQFVGIGGTGFISRLFGGYGIFEKLSTLSGRYVDNADFFALDDFKKVDNAELYSRLLNGFSDWLKEIKTKGII